MSFGTAYILIDDGDQMTPLEIHYSEDWHEPDHSNQSGGYEKTMQKTFAISMDVTKLLSEGVKQCIDDMLREGGHGEVNDLKWEEI